MRRAKVSVQDDRGKIGCTRQKVPNLKFSAKIAISPLIEKENEKHRNLPDLEKITGGRKKR